MDEGGFLPFFFYTLLEILEFVDDLIVSKLSTLFEGELRTSLMPWEDWLLDGERVDDSVVTLMWLVCFLGAFVACGEGGGIMISSYTSSWEGEKTRGWFKSLRGREGGAKAGEKVEVVRGN